VKPCSVSVSLALLGFASCCYTSFPFSQRFPILYCCFRFSFLPMPHTCSQKKKAKREKAPEHQLEVQLLVILASTKTTYKSEILFDAPHLPQGVVHFVQTVVTKLVPEIDDHSTYQPVKNTKLKKVF